MLDKAHSLQLALVAHHAMQRAACEPPRDTVLLWCLDIVTHARFSFAPDSAAKCHIDNFRACFPGACGGGWSNRLPASLLAESFMGLVSGKECGILKPGNLFDVYPYIEVSQRFGPLVLLHITLPTNRNTSKWMDFTWTDGVFPLTKQPQSSTDFQI